MPAIGSHSTGTRDEPWDGPGATAAAPNDRAVLRHMHAWVEAGADPDVKASYKFPHHAPRAGSTANLAGVRNALSRLPQANIPAADRAGVQRHLRRHLEEGQGGGASMGAPDDEIVPLTVEGESPQFRVDRPRRQISGLVLPWGQVAKAQGRRWRFVRGSLRWADAGRVKLLRDHDLRNPVGRALSLDDREDGLWGTFSVARGQAGDEVLSLAEDGVLDGFSAGPVIEPGGWEVDRSDRDVALVSDARLVEVTVTAIPAFDDARVHKVAASAAQAGGTRMSADDKGKTGDGGQPTLLDSPDAGMARFETELDERFKALTDRLASSAEAQQEKVAATVAAAFQSAFERLESMDAQGQGAAAAARFQVIKEPPVYRFDGDVHQPSLVRDAWQYHISRDYDARDRLFKFQQQQQDMVRFQTVNTTNASSVIPPGYRPDLFVTQLMQGRPIVAQVSRGTISDATPFTVPRFVSASVAGVHTEGVNPTAGSLVTEPVVVQPVAISGIFELTREVVDSSNPAIDAIAMAAMREDWNRQTEQRAYTALKGAASTFDTVSLAGLPAGGPALIDKVSDLLARYPFTRFAAPSGAVISQLVTRSFAGAKDSTGRRLLPTVGAQNAAGLGNAVQQGWFVDGLAFVPAWAVTEAVGDDVTLIVNRADAWAWESPLLTFRFEEKRGPALIELALFGYYATHTLRPAGVFAVRAVV